MVMKKRLKRYTALLLAASMVLSSSGMTTLGTEIGSSVESSDTESSGDSGSTQGSSSEEGGSSDSASEGGSSSHEQSESGSEDGNNPDGEGSGSEGSGSDNESDSESGKTETDDDPDGNTSDSKDPEESDDGNSNTSDSEDSEEGDNDSQTSDNKEEESGEGSHGGNGGGGSAGGGSGSGGNIGSGEIQGNPDADDPKAEDELIVDEEDKKDEDDKDNEDEINDYILEAIVFPEQERAAESIRKSAMRSARMLANTLNSDESSEDNEDESGENGSDIADSSSSNYIERQVDVGDTVDDLKLPKEIILKVRPVEDEDDADAETEGETDSGSDTASKSDAKKAGTDNDGSDTAETKGNEDNDSAEKDNKDEKDLEEIRIRLEEEDWMIASPMEFAGDDLGSFNTDGIELLDEDGEPTGEYSEEYAQYPQYILVPNFDNLDIENEEGISLNMVDMLDEDESSTIEDYLMKNVAVMARVGETREGDIIDGVVQVPLNLLGQQTETSEYYEYDGENAKLILKTGTENATKYRLYIAERTGGNTDIPTISIEFDSSLANKDIEITIDGDSNPGKTIEIGDSEFDHPTIDLSEIKSLNLSITGNVVIKGGYETATIRVPEAKSLSIGGTGNLTVSSDEESVAIGTKVDGQLMGTVNITGGNITINADAQGVGVGSYSATGTGGRLNVTGGSVSIGGGRYRNSEYLFPLQNITLNVTDKAGRFFVHSNNVNANDGLLKITEGQTYLRGAMKDKVGSSGLVIDVTGTEGINPNWSDRIELGDGDQGFMLRVPKADTYTLSGEETAEGVQRTFGYIGDLDGVSSGDFKVGSDKTVTYENVRKVYLPVFWDSSAVITGTMTAEGYLDVKLSAAVDIRNERSNTPGTTIYDAGTEDKEKYGFLIYRLDESGERTDLKYLEIDEDEVIGGEGNADTLGLQIKEESERGAAYEITIPKNDEKNRLTPGETYYVVPYVRTNAGYREAEEIKYGGIDEDGNYDENDPVVIEEDPVIVLKMPKIEFPEKIEFTYGTMTGNALDRQEFHNLTPENGISYPTDGKSVIIDGVTLTFTTPKTADNAIWGTNIDNASFRLNKTTEGENGGWGNVTVTVPTESDGEPVNDYTYPEGTFVAEFIAPESTAEDEHNQVVYENITKAVEVTVNPRQLDITGISDGSDTKVYDKNTDVIWKDPDSKTAVTLSEKVIPNIYPGTADSEDDVYVDLKNYDGATYDSADAGERKIIFKNPVLGGEDKANYVLPESDTVTGKITGKQITVKPVNYKKKTGEEYPNGDYKVEIVNSAESGVTVDDLTVSNEYFVINSGKPTNDEPRQYAFTLDEGKFNNANSNYEITYEVEKGATYTIEQDKAVLDENGNENEDGAYVINPTTNAEVKNGWYKDSVVIAPKEDLGSGKANYYDKIRNNTAGDDASKSPAYEDSLTYTTTQKGVKIQLNNSTTGAYTSIDTAKDYYVDKDTPVITTSDIEYKYTDGSGAESVLKKALHLLGFGNFFNKDLTVTVPATDETSGVWYIEVTKTPDSGNPTTEKYYFNGEKDSSEQGNNIPAPGDVGNKHKSASVQFTIESGFKGTIKLKVVDHAGKESAVTSLGNEKANGKWNITTEKPVVESLNITGSSNGSGDTLWYNGNTSAAVISEINDTKAAAGIQKIEVYIDGAKDPIVIDGDESGDKVFNQRDTATLEYTYDTYKLTNETDNGSIKIIAYNNAGNVSDEKIIDYKYDATDPSIDESSITYKFKDEGWVGSLDNFFEFGHFFNDTVEAKIPVTDQTSGVDKVYYELLDNNGDSLSHDNITKEAEEADNENKWILKIPNIDSDEGWSDWSGYIKYYAEDVAGNKSDIKTLQNKNGKLWVVEDGAPEISYTYLDMDTKEKVEPIPVTTGEITEYWYDTKLTVNANVTDKPEDNYSGLNNIEYNLGGKEDTVTIVADKGSSNTERTKDKLVSADIITEGENIGMSVTAADNAGNSNTVKESINIDLTAPQIDNLAGVPEDNAAYRNTNITISFDVTDTLSGVKLVTLTRIKDGIDKEANDNITLTPSGNRFTATIDKNGEYRIIAEDNVGHKGYSSFTIRNLDKIINDPKIEIDPHEPQNSSKAYTDDTMTFIMEASDAETTGDSKKSGIVKYQISNVIDPQNPVIMASGDWTSQDNSSQKVDIDVNSGLYQLKIVVYDNAGNSSDYTMPDPFTVSNQRPRIFGEIKTTGVYQDDITGEGKWLNEAEIKLGFKTDLSDRYTVLQLDDNKSGKYIDVPGGEEISDTVEIPYTVSDEGITNLSFRVHHTVSNLSSAPLDYIIKLDRIKPDAPDIKVGSSHPANNWYTYYPDITMTLKDKPTANEAPEKIVYKLWSGPDGSIPEDSPWIDYYDGTKPRPKTDETWHIAAKVVDEAENESDPVIVTFNVDATDSSISDITVTKTKDAWYENIPGIGGWFTNETLTVTVTVNDGTSGVKNLQYQINNNNGAETGTWESAVPESGSGDSALIRNFTFEIDPNEAIDAKILLKAFDSAGNEADPEKIIKDSLSRWTVENNPPVISNPDFKISGTDETPTESTDKLDGTTKWYTSNIDLSITVNDEDSGLNRVNVNFKKDSVSSDSGDKLGDPKDKTQPYVFGKTALGDGRYSLTMDVTDNSGNTASLGTDDNTPGISFNIDATAPAVRLPVLPPGSDGWYTEILKDLSFTLSDSMSGLYTGNGEGKVSLHRTKDASGAALNPAEKISIISGENGTYSFDISENGTYTISASDNAGNSVISENEFKVSGIDTTKPTAPSISIKRASGEQGNIQDWYQTAPEVYITVSPKETEAEQSAITTYYYAWKDSSVVIDSAEDLLEGTIQNAKTPVYKTGVLSENPFNSDGNWHIVVWAQDEAGNISEWKAENVKPVNLDRADPVIDKITQTPTDSTAGPVIITIPVTEATGELSEKDIVITGPDGNTIEISKDDIKGPDADGKYTITVDVSTNGEYKVKVTDDSGRTAEKFHTVDNIAGDKIPQPEILVNDAKPSDTWYTVESVVLKIAKGDDETATVKNTTHFTIRNTLTGAVIVADGKLPEADDTPKEYHMSLTDGRYEVEAWTERVVDGKTQSTKDNSQKATVKVDRTAPVISYVNGNPTAWTMKDAEIIFSVTDATSGITGINENNITVTGPDPVDPSKTTEYKVEKTAEGQYKFTAKINGNYNITAADNAGLSATTTPVKVTRIDKTDAETATMSVAKAEGTGSDIEGTKWYKAEDGIPVITIVQPKRNDPAGEITDVSPVHTFYRIDSRELGDSDFTEGNTVDYTQNGTAPVLLKDGIYRISVWTMTEAAKNDKDEDAKTSLPAKLLYVDITKPGAGYAEVKPVNDGPVAKAINYLTFGNFFNEGIEITVTVRETAEATSGPKTLYYEISESPDEFSGNLSDAEKVDFTGDEAVFEIADKDLMDIFEDAKQKYIKYYVEDGAGNLSAAVAKIKGEGSSDLWMLENSFLGIDFDKNNNNGISSEDTTPNRDDQNRLWYNKPVTVSADITNKASGLSEVKGEYKYKGTTTPKPVTVNKDSFVSEAELSQTINNEGTTVFDIYAKDNAGNEKRLSTDTANAAFNAESERTIRIDTKAPEIKKETEDPGDWIETPSYDIYFTVNDYEDGLEKGTDFSGTDLTTGTDESSSIRVVKADENGNFEGTNAEYIEVERARYGEVPENPDEDLYTFRFTVEENGLYRIYARDFAGNEAANIDVTVDKIPSWDTLEEPVDKNGETEIPDGDPSLKYGYTTHSKSDGNAVDTYSGSKWYKSVPTNVTVTNYKDFVVNSDEDNTTPVMTKYALLNRSVQEFKDDETWLTENNILTDVGYNDSDTSKTEPVPETTSPLRFSAEVKGVTYTDGIWVLFVRNEYTVKKEGSFPHSEWLRVPFFVDTTKPKISAPEDDDDDWKQTKEIKFTVYDPDLAAEKGFDPDDSSDNVRGSTSSGIDQATVQVKLNGHNIAPGDLSGPVPVSGRYGMYEYTFTARERGTYTIDVSDKAGNPAVQESVTVEHLSDEVPKLAEITVDPSEGNGGNVSDSELNVPSYEQGAIWYSTAVNNTPAKPKLSLTKPKEAEGAAPIVTHYEIWQGDTYDSSKAISGSIADNGGNGDWQDNELSRIVKEITEDGQWNIRTWSVSESGVSTLPDPENETGYKRRTVFVDNTAPAIGKEIVSIETVNDGLVEKLLNTLSFGIFFNEAIGVTVKVTDDLSLGKDLHYTYERADGKESAEQTSPIKWNADDKTEGTAVISLPVGTKGQVKMWATDIAGNISKSEVLTYMGTDHWEIETAAPNVLGTDPLGGEDDVLVNIDSIDIIFDERIEANDEGAVSIISGGDRFTATPSDAKRIEIKPTDPQNTPDDSTEGVHRPWTASIDITEFKDSNGNPIELLGNFYYTVDIDGGAFKDLAGNSSNGETVYFHTSADIPLPVIGDIDVNLPQGAIMEPEDFSSDHNDYVILILDNALDSTKTHLENDLVMDVDMKGNVHVDEAVLTDIVGNVIAGADTDVLWQPDASGEGGRVVIPADKVEASENYFLKLRVSSHGAENTYSFFISTSAISATSEDVGSIGVTVDNDELLASMHDELQKDAIENWKVVLKFRAAAVPESSAGTELEAILKALETAEIRDSSLGYFPLDLSVTKTYARTGATDKVDKLNSPIDVRITLPEDSLGRELYGIYRYDPDTGAAVKVEHTLNADGTVATVSTDNFSGKYAVVYDAKPKSSGGGGGGSSGGSGGGPSGSGGSGAGTVTVSGTTAYYGGTWVNDGYLFIESDGSRPSNEWLRIDGKLYRFGLDGFRTTAYLQYKFNPDGSLNGDLPADIPVRDATGTWLKDGWWYKTVSGGYLAGGWYYLFYQGRFEWYYFNADGWMLDGWLTLTDTPGDGGPADTSEVNPDGTPVQRTYYLHTTHDWTRGRMYTDWHFIDGKWYYFRTKPEGHEGSLVRNGITLTGHRVGPDGAWDGVGPTPTEAQ